MSIPYLSIVFGVGGNLSPDLLARMNKSLAHNTDLIRKHGIDAEIVIVEWNLPPERATIHPCISADRHGVPIRLIHVSRAIHARMENPHGFQYFEWFPKNIGIRRARGEFVLSTNPDDLWSDELAAYLAKKELERTKFYRVNRHDVDANGQVFRICWPTGAYPPSACAAEIRKPRERAAPWSEGMLHYNAAGDFTLMSSADWSFIHGNPERDYNDSVDGQTVYLAHTLGLRQIVLPYPIYHPDHERTLNFSHSAGRSHGGTWNDNEPFTKQNGVEWGFAGVEFPETVL